MQKNRVLNQMMIDDYANFSIVYLSWNSWIYNYSRSKPLQTDKNLQVATMSSTNQNKLEVRLDGHTRLGQAVVVHLWNRVPPPSEQNCSVNLLCLDSLRAACGSPPRRLDRIAAAEHAEDEAGQTSRACPYNRRFSETNVI